MTPELVRLQATREQKVPWKKWGPYLSERQWGTVREDYSESGDAWGYFTHDHARSRAYHWGEDGLAGLSDEQQFLCFALALWNGQDPILKERLFGLTNSEANHGEDVKEYYFYLDSTPTHSYMKYLYKYPQVAYPYDELVRVNGARSRDDFEYELIDTGIFDQDRYFDVFVEYAKESPDDLLIQISLANRGPDAASLHVLPTLWFRNTWAWFADGPAKPVLKQIKGPARVSVIEASHAELGIYYLYGEAAPPLLFTENETNTERISGAPNTTPYVKDGLHNCIVHGQTGAVNPNLTGTKAAAHYQLTVGAGETNTIRLRITVNSPTNLKSYGRSGAFGKHFADIMQQRRAEADEFYNYITPIPLARMPVWCCARPWPGCSGPNSFTTTMLTTGWASAGPVV